MTVFVKFTPAASAETAPAAGPLEFFPSVEAALRELTDRGRNKTGHRALAAGAPSHTSAQWRLRREPVDFPEAREGVGGWVALVWWRRAGEKPPQAGDPVGEIWLSVGPGKVDRNRSNPAAWNTGRSGNGANARKEAAR